MSILTGAVDIVHFQTLDANAFAETCPLVSFTNIDRVSTEVDDLYDEPEDDYPVYTALFQQFARIHLELPQKELKTWGEDTDVEGVIVLSKSTVETAEQTIEAGTHFYFNSTWYEIKVVKEVDYIGHTETPLHLNCAFLAADDQDIRIPE